MTRKFLLLTMTLIASTSWASDTRTKMQEVFSHLVELIPYITDEEAFKNKKNEANIQQHLVEMNEAFKKAKHEEILKQDIFAPSYQLIREHLADSVESFKKGNKDYVNWRMKEVTSLCLDCHTRLPAEHASSFEEGKSNIDNSKFKNRYNFGIAQLIVRKYPDAKQTFTQVIDEKLLKKEIQELEMPFKQLLLINLKVSKDPANMLTVTDYYLGKSLPEDIKNMLTVWSKDLKRWKSQPKALQPEKTEEGIRNFIFTVVKPLFKNDAMYLGGADVDLLLSSGILSNYLFENPKAKIAPEIIFWLGLAEKYLKRDQFFSSGDLFFKLCVRRYPKSEMARRCFDEYQNSMEFEFTGSRGTDIPDDIQQEINELKALLKK